MKEFYCEKCDITFKSRDFIKITENPLRGRKIYKFLKICDECGERIYKRKNDPHDVASGMKPTKRVIIGDKRFWIHGDSPYDKYGYPADLQETLEKEKEIRKQKEDSDGKSDDQAD